MTRQLNILIAPDKMKGTLTAKQICEVFERIATENTFVDSNGENVRFNCASQPLADGGDGSLDVLKGVLPLKMVKVKVNGPLMEPLLSRYAIDDMGNAYIEMAAAAGLVQVPLKKRNCMHTTSYGFGEVIRHAITKKIKKIYLFLGGSATCDAGIGMASALGYRFTDQKGNVVPAFGGQLKRVHHIKKPAHLDKIQHTKFIALYDVSNPILGPDGAAPAFAPQKGANPQEVKVLEEGLTNVVHLMQVKRRLYETMQPDKENQKKLVTLTGGGAAGGMGLATHYFLGAQLSPGTSAIMTLTKLREKIKNQNVVITAEGQIDASTLNGKVPFGVSQEAKTANVPCYVLGGVIKLSEAQKLRLGATKLYSLSDSIGKAKAISKAEEALSQVAKAMLNDIAYNCKKE